MNWDEGNGSTVSQRFDDDADFPQPKAVTVDVKALAAELSKKYVKKPYSPPKRLRTYRATIRRTK